MALTEIPSELSSTPSIVDNGNATAITIGSDESVALGGTLTVDTDTLVVDATNNRVGVGTSSPSNSMTISNGSSGVTEANGAIVPLVVENSSSAYINFLTPNNANAGFLFSDPEGNNVGQMQYLHGSDALVFATSATERMRIDSSGNLLVGRTATSGLGKLQVYGAADFAGGNVLLCRDTGNVGIGTTSLAAKLTVGTFGDTARAAQFHGGSILIDGGAATDLIMGDGNVAYMSLQTTDDATAMKIRDYSGNADLVTVERASGNVGIGTSSPDTTLHLQTPSGTKSEINFAQTAVTNYRIGVPASTDALVFTYGASTERMRLDASGNLLVGTTSGGARLRVTGASAASASIVQVGTNGYPAISFNNTSGVQQGYIVTNASSVSLVSVSDQRLKENIADADDAGSKIDAIQVRKFDWKADGSHQDYGMVAQELETVAPEAVHQPADLEEMRGVDYSKLVPMLVKEIQSLRSRVAELENN